MKQNRNLKHFPPYAAPVYNTLSLLLSVFDYLFPLKINSFQFCNKIP